jgi:hypothetical protein
MMRAKYVLHAETHGTVFIVYRDTEGRWDELLHTGIRFRGFAPYQGEVPPEGGRAYG